MQFSTFNFHTFHNTKNQIISVMDAGWNVYCNKLYWMLSNDSPSPFIRLFSLISLPNLYYSTQCYSLLAWPLLPLNYWGRNSVIVSILFIFSIVILSNIRWVGEELITLLDLWSYICDWIENGMSMDIISFAGS